MSATAIIPARYASTRFPGKPLAAETGKPLIQHVYESVAAAKQIDRVLVATDDERIAAAVRGFGGEVAMTRADHVSGTDRVAEAAAGLDTELIVNVQGDEPEMEPEAIDTLVDLMANHPDASMGSLACRFKRIEDVLNPACVKVVIDATGNAICFSRSLVPYPRDTGGQVDRPERWLLHLGIYAYRPAFLAELTQTPACALERTEQLEQLRVVHMGRKIAMAVIERASTGIDTPEQYAEFVKRYRTMNSVNKLTRSLEDNSSQSSDSRQVDSGCKGPSKLVCGTQDAEKTPPPGPSKLVCGSKGTNDEPWQVGHHTPPHLMVDDTWYLISASTWKNAPFFTDPKIARTMCETIEQEYHDRGWSVEAYVVMPTHYHVVAYAKVGRDLAAICKRVHGVMAAVIRNTLKKNKPDGQLPPKYFHHYWDKCLNSEKDWLDSLEYVRMNPVSSGLVSEAEQWLFCGPKNKPSTS